jgi:hypothetical protein
VATLEAMILESGVEETAEDTRTIKKIGRDRPLPVSFAQQRLWFIDQFNPGSYLYNVPSIFRISGELNVSALQRTLNEIVRRHEVLRTTFVDNEGVPVQIVGPPHEMNLPVFDLRGLPESERESEAERLSHEESRSPFDLAKGPMFRARLIRTAESEFVLVLNIHHICTDGWSKGILLKELSALYAAFAQGNPSPLAALPVQYGDFSAWQRDWEKTPDFQSHIDYWRNRLSGAPEVIELPTDRPRPDIAEPQGDWEIFSIPRGTAAKIRDLSHEEGATLYMTLLAAYQTLLHTYSRQTDIVIGTDLANRNQPEVEGLIGFFLNHGVLRIDLTGDPTFRDLLRRVKEMALEAFAHQDVSFDKLVEILNPQRVLSHAPLFQVLFVLQNAPVSKLELPGVTLQPIRVDHKTSKYDLSLFIHEAEGDLPAAFLYRVDLFDASTITGMRERFVRLLQSITTNPDTKIGSLDIGTIEPAPQSSSPVSKLQGIRRKAATDLPG